MITGYKVVSQLEFFRIFSIGFILGAYFIHHFYTQRNLYVAPLRILKRAFHKFVIGKKL